MSPASAIAISKERSRHLLARRARSRSRSVTPSREASREARLHKARARDEEERMSDPKKSIISGYLGRRADGQSDSAARAAMSAERSMGRHELLAELIEAADAMRDDAIGEIGLSLVRGCVSDWTREFEGGEAAAAERPEELPLPPPADKPRLDDGGNPNAQEGQGRSGIAQQARPLPRAAKGHPLLGLGRAPHRAWGSSDSGSGLLLRQSSRASTPPPSTEREGASSTSPWQSRSPPFMSFVEQVTRPRDWHAGASSIPQEARALGAPPPRPRSAWACSSWSGSWAGPTSIRRRLEERPREPWPASVEPRSS